MHKESDGIAQKPLPTADTDCRSLYRQNLFPIIRYRDIQIVWALIHSAYSKFKR